MLLQQGYLSNNQIDLYQSMSILQNYLRYLVLGAIQGLTEFLPISSTAHLKVLPILFGWGDPGVSIAAVLQLGSIIAVFAYFRKDLQAILKGVSLGIRHGQWEEPSARIGLAIFIGTIPIVLTGMFIKLFWPGYESSDLRSIPLIALISIAMAIFLGAAEKIGSRKKNLKTMRVRDGFVIGLAQIFALIPGVSRSGITLSTALFDKWERDSAARFSFLLGIPAISISGMVELKHSFNQPLKEEILPMILGIISSAIVSWLAIDWLLKFLQRNSSWIFVIYRLLFGVLILSWWKHFPSS